MCRRGQSVHAARLIYEASKRKDVIILDALTMYEQHKQMVFRLALSYTKSVPDAEDICQAAFLRYIERRSTVTPGKEKAWLATVTANLCRDLLRARKAHPTEPLEDRFPFASPEESELFSAVMALGAKERAAVYLHYYEGYSSAEIGKILGISRSAVTTRLYQARKHLRNILEATNNEK